MEQQIKMYINNNPKCNVKLYSAVKNEEWVMENKPYIQFNGEKFSNEEIKVIVRVETEKIHESIIIPEKNCFEIRVEIENQINENSVVSVEANGRIYRFSPKFIKVCGTVKYIDGTPVVNPVINFTSKDVSIVGDENGYYEMILSDKEEQIGIFDQGYSVNTLEVWLSNLDLLEDRNIDFIIDKLELYRIKMWSGEQSDYIHFIPMSVTRVNKVMSKGYASELEIMKDPEVWIRLEREDVSVFSDDEEIRILSFSEVDDFLAEIDGTAYNRPSYVISVPKVDRNKLVKIVIKSEVEFNNEVVKEYGLGYVYW